MFFDEEIRKVLTLVAGVLCVLSFVPYIWKVIKRRCFPQKATWIIWGILDTIVAVGMYEENALNGHIVGSLIGIWLLVLVCFKYGQSGWSRTDKYCLLGALVSLFVWWLFNSPLLAIVITLLVMFIGAWPTVASVWVDPKREDPWAWSISTVSCVFSVTAIPAFTLAHAAQPIVFTVIEGAVLGLIAIRIRPKKRIEGS